MIDRSPWHVASFKGLFTFSVLAVTPLACSPSTAAAPFDDPKPRPTTNAQDAAASTGDSLLTVDDPGPTAPSRDETLGGRCIADEQCDDGIECTFDACDMELQRCRFSPDDSLCQDESYCNGREECRPSHGCEVGQAVACDDEAPCTLDRCDEATRACVRTARDIDADGDVDEHCQSFGADAGTSVDELNGGDCNDQDPNISSLHDEVCGNEVDDNCNGKVDEAMCSDAIGDACRSTLRVTESGIVELQFGALSADVASGCGPAANADAIVWLEPEQAAAVYVRGVSDAADLMLSLQSTCGDALTETACSWGQAPQSSAFEPRSVAVLGLGEVAEGPIALRVAVTGYGPRSAELEIRFEAPMEPAPNDTCSEALPIRVGEPMLADLRLAKSDIQSSCAVGRSRDGAVLEGTPLPSELSYELVLDEAQDVTVFAVSEDSASTPVLALYAEQCAAEDELLCVQSDQSDLFARSLPQGRYLLTVAADIPSQVQFEVTLAAPSVPPQGDACQQPLEATPWDALALDTQSMADDFALGCSNFGRDVSYQFELARASDVLLRARASAGDRAAVALSSAASTAGGSDCAPESFTCGANNGGVARVVLHNLPQGTYLGLVESARGNPVEPMIATRPARAPIIVASADTCDEALSVPSGGAYFTGNTKHAGFDETASCDLGGASLSTPDQWLSLTFEQPTHLILHTTGSEIPLLLNLRSGASCPGKELQQACLLASDSAVGAYFERRLPAGQYWLQVMGYAGSSGRWELEIFSDASK